MNEAVPVRRGTDADIPLVVPALADAFAGDPPLRWFLAEAPDRARRLRIYFASLLRLHVARGELWVSDEPRAAAAWMAPATYPLPARDQLMIMPMLLRVFWRHPMRMLNGAHVIDENHPERPAWLLDYIGVDPAAQGRGTGAALLAPMLEHLDRERQPACLNAGSPRSRDLYLRHGFAVTEEFRLPYDGPPLWRMWREPTGG